MGGPCGVKKGKSKKKQLHRKYREEKLVRQHHKKLKKVARKAKAAGITAPGRKDPGIPNSAPHFKEEILRDAAAHKERVESEREKRIEVQKAARRKKLKEARSKSLQDLANDAQRRGDDFNRTQAAPGESDGMKDIAGAREKAQYMKQLREVVSIADVVLVVLDARNPQGCRCKMLEDLIMQSGGGNKRIILVMNKIDLVPRGVVQAWLKVLRMELPTIAFKAVTAIASAANDSKINVNSGECLGGAALLQLLKNYSRSHNIKKAITVGVVGFPNVGKSSLINSLKRGKAVGVSSQAGYTKSLQEVKLDSKVTLVDSPGVLLASESDPDAILTNCVRIDKLADPVTPVESILRRCHTEQLLKLYEISQFRDSQEFLVQICKKRGKMLKGGRPDILSAARTVLEDWNTGRVPFYMLPPAPKKVSAAHASIVTEWSREFDLEKASQEEIAAVEGMAASSTEFMEMASGGAMAMDDFMDDEDEVSGEMDCEEESDEEKCELMV